MDIAVTIRETQRDRERSQKIAGYFQEFNSLHAYLISLFLLMIKQTIEFPMTSTMTSMTRTVVIPADADILEGFQC